MTALVLLAWEIYLGASGKVAYAVYPNGRGNR
jgi:hypothetical protein